MSYIVRATNHQLMAFKRRMWFSDKNSLYHENQKKKNNRSDYPRYFKKSQSI